MLVGEVCSGLKSTWPNDEFEFHELGENIVRKVKKKREKNNKNKNNPLVKIAQFHHSWQKVEETIIWNRPRGNEFKIFRNADDFVYMFYFYKKPFF